MDVAVSYCECGCGARMESPPQGGRPRRLLPGHSFPPDTPRTCTDCGETKPLADFAPSNSKGSGGYAGHCRACKNARARAYYERNSEARRAYQNAKRRTALGREYDMMQTRKRRSRQKTGDNILPLVVLERDDGACGICGEDVDPMDFHVDHVVPLALGGSHVYENVQAAHPACNQAKAARVAG